MTVLRPLALFLGLAALALCLFALLIQPNALTLMLSAGYAGAVFAMISKQARWIAVLAALFCIGLSAVCGVVGFLLLINGDWYSTTANKLQFFSAIFLLGTAGPLLSLYVLYRMYTGNVTYP
ncbi:MAG: hypothetical protein AAFX10_05325 [Pseudomonadota bacterium]